MTLTNIFTAIILTMVAVGIWLLGRHLRYRERRGFTHRELLSDSQIYERFYQASGLDEAAVKSIWHEISNALELESGFLRPTDEFGRTFAKNWLTNDVLEDLELRATARAKRMNRRINLSKIRTVDDYIRAFANSANEHVAKDPLGEGRL